MGQCTSDDVSTIIDCNIVLYVQQLVSSPESLLLQDLCKASYKSFKLSQALLRGGELELLLGHTFQERLLPKACIILRVSLAMQEPCNDAHAH